MLEPFVVAVPVCLAVPEKPDDEPLFVFEAEVVASPVFVAEVVASPVFVAEVPCVCIAEPEPVYHGSVW